MESEDCKDQAEIACTAQRGPFADVDPAAGAAALALGVDALDAGADVAAADVDGQAADADDLAVDGDAPAADEAACGGEGFEVQDAADAC